jgi:hypothetical protein
MLKILNQNTTGALLDKSGNKTGDTVIIYNICTTVDLSIIMAIRTILNVLVFQTFKFKCLCDKITMSFWLDFVS